MTTNPEMSEGAQRLATICAKGTFIAAASKIGTTEGAIRHYVRGRRLPSEVVRVRIAEAYGIEPSAWERPCVAGIANGATTLPQDAGCGIGPSARPIGAAKAPEGEANAVRLVDNRTKLREVIASIERELAACDLTIPVNHRASLFNALTTTVAKLARLEGEGAVSEAQILRSPAWQRILRVTRSVLSRFPGSAVALDEEMRRISAEEESN